MTRSLGSWAYRQILKLYPDPFRREFGTEMLSVFEECQAKQGSCFLLADGLAMAIKQQMHSFAASTPAQTLPYWEVPSSPRLAHHLAMAVLAVAVLAHVFVRDEMPRRQLRTPIHIEGRIWYLQSTALAPHRRSEHSKLR